MNSNRAQRKALKAIGPQVEDGVLRKVYVEAYQQAEKDMIDIVHLWIRDHVGEIFVSDFDEYIQENY